MRIVERSKLHRLHFPSEKHPVLIHTHTVESGNRRDGPLTSRSWKVLRTRDVNCWQYVFPSFNKVTVVKIARPSRPVNFLPPSTGLVTSQCFLNSGIPRLETRSANPLQKLTPFSYLLFLRLFRNLRGWIVPWWNMSIACATPWVQLYSLPWICDTLLFIDISFLSKWKSFFF